MLMAWGPYRFTVPNYSVETLRRSAQPRVEAQPVIGRRPPIHKLGPGNDTVTLESTFHPHHFNGNGLAQLSAIRQAVNSMESLQLIHMNGNGINVLGSWVATGLEDEHTMFAPDGTAEVVTVSLSLMCDDDSTARAIALSAISSTLNFSAGGSLNLGGLSASISTKGLSASVGIGF